MEEPEVPTEHLHEAVHEEAHYSHERWITGVALSAALLAALAAVAALLAGTDANEAVIARGTASNTWSQFDMNSVKLANLEANIDMLKLDNKAVPDRFKEKIDKYNKEKTRLQEQARTEVKAYHQLLARHETLAHAVTMFQVAIAVSAIAALTKRRPFWYLGLAFGAVGIGFLVYALAVMPVAEIKEEEGEPAPTKAVGGQKSEVGSQRLEVGVHGLACSRTLKRELQRSEITNRLATACAFRLPTSDLGLSCPSLTPCPLPFTPGPCPA